MSDIPLELEITPKKKHKTLSPNELSILELYLTGKNYSEIAGITGITRQKVSEVVNSPDFEAEYYIMTEARKQAICDAQTQIISECLGKIREKITCRNALRILEVLLKYHS